VNAAAHLGSELRADLADDVQTDQERHLVAQYQRAFDEADTILNWHAQDCSDCARRLSADLWEEVVLNVFRDGKFQILGQQPLQDVLVLRRWYESALSA
jgi:hypothetical protein